MKIIGYIVSFESNGYGNKEYKITIALEFNGAITNRIIIPCTKANFEEMKINFMQKIPIEIEIKGQE